MLEGPSRCVLAIEIKCASPERPGKGFLLGCKEVEATERFVVIPEGERHPHGVENGGYATARDDGVLGVCWGCVDHTSASRRFMFKYMYVA